MIKAIISIFVFILLSSLVWADTNFFLKWRPPFLPFAISIDNKLNFKLTGEKSFITPLGMFSIGSTVGHLIKGDQDNAMLVVVRNQILNKENRFMVHSNEKIEVIIDGRAKIQIQKHLVFIDITYSESEIIHFIPVDRKVSSTLAVVMLNKIISEEWRLDTFHDHEKDMHIYDKGCQDILTFFDEGDFNGDGNEDIAIGSRNNKNLLETRIFVIWGPLFSTYSSIGWSKPFRIIRSKAVESTWERNSLLLAGDAIEMHQCEVSSWIMYWNGQSFSQYTMTD